MWHQIIEWCCVDPRCKSWIWYLQYIAACLAYIRQLINVCGNDTDGDLKAYNITCLYHLCFLYPVFYFNLRYMYVHRDVTLWRRKKKFLSINVALERKPHCSLKGFIFNDFERNLWVKDKCDWLRIAVHF